MKARVVSHPGVVLSEMYLKEIGITQVEFAKCVGVSFRTINEIINQKRGISVDMALRLARALDTTPQFWLNLQNNYDLSCADTKAVQHIKALLPA